MPFPLSRFTRRVTLLSAASLAALALCSCPPPRKNPSVAARW